MQCGGPASYYRLVEPIVLSHMPVRRCIQNTADGPDRADAVHSSGGATFISASLRPADRFARCNLGTRITIRNLLIYLVETAQYPKGATSSKTALRSTNGS